MTPHTDYKSRITGGLEHCDNCRQPIEQLRGDSIHVVGASDAVVYLCKRCFANADVVALALKQNSLEGGEFNG